MKSALGPAREPAAVRGAGPGCSALLRLLPNNTDLLVAHDTWNSYQSMLRILKKYSMPVRARRKGGERVPGAQLAFSGYPVLPHSAPPKHH